jgi:hypothetical protein
MASMAHLFSESNKRYRNPCPVDHFTCQPDPIKKPRFCEPTPMGPPHAWPPCAYSPCHVRGGSPQQDYEEADRGRLHRTVAPLPHHTQNGTGPDDRAQSSEFHTLYNRVYRQDPGHEPASARENLRPTAADGAQPELVAPWQQPARPTRPRAASRPPAPGASAGRSRVAGRRGARAADSDSDEEPSWSIIADWQRADPAAAAGGGGGGGRAVWPSPPSPSPPSPPPSPPPRTSAPPLPPPAVPARAPGWPGGPESRQSPDRLDPFHDDWHSW